MSLPQKLPLPLMQTTWASQLDPVVNFPANQGILIKNQPLISGVTVINHKLQRTQQGWIIIDQDAQARIYRSQPFNTLTLTLTSDAATNISLWVF